MKKDIVISILGAVIISQQQWTSPGSRSQEIMAITGVAATLFIFLLFFGEMRGKIRKYCKRVKATKQKVNKLRGFNILKKTTGKH